MPQPVLLLWSVAATGVGSITMTLTLCCRLVSTFMLQLAKQGTTGRSPKAGRPHKKSPVVPVGCICPALYAPVCAASNHTFSNACQVGWSLVCVGCAEAQAVVWGGNALPCPALPCPTWLCAVKP